MNPDYQEAVVTRNVDGLAYTSSKFPALTQLRLLARLTEVLGPHGVRLVVLRLTSSTSASLGQLMRVAQTPTAIVDIAGGVLKDLPLVVELLKRTKVNQYRIGNEGGPLSAEKIDSHFQGEIPHLINVLGFVIGHNFAGFTRGLHSISGSPTSDETTEETPSVLPIQNEG